MADTEKLQSRGIKFIIGRLKGETKTTVQSVLFAKTAWNASKARAWLKEHKFRADKLDETENNLRFRQRNPKDFKPGSFRTINAGSRLSEATIGTLLIILEKVYMEEEAKDMTKQKVKTHSFHRTTVKLFHFHSYDGSAEFTDPPFGLADGHMHDINRDDDGRVTSFGAAVDHTHKIFEGELHDPAVEATLKDGILHSLSDHFDAFLASLIKKDKLNEGPPLKSVKDTLSGHDDDDDDDNEDPEGKKIFGVEIFRTGIWNEQKYTRKDLDYMVEAFNKVGFRPPLKIGHDEKSGDRAFGWVQSLYRIGNKLFADFIDIPIGLYKLIKERAFDAVSAEIYINLDRNGKKFPRVLKAVALLGAETPGADLAPLRTAVNTIQDFDFDKVLVYTLEVDDWKVEMDTKELQDKVKELEEKLKKITVEKDKAETELKTHKESEASDELVKEVEKALNEVEEARKEAEKQLEITKEELKKASSADSDEIKHLKEEVERLNKIQQDLKEERQKELIARKVDECSLPAIHEHLKILYGVAMGSDEVVKFKKDDKEEEVSPEVVLDRLVSIINENAKKLFKELGESGRIHRDDGPKDDRPDVEVTERARKYAAEHEVSFKQAVEAVLEADPELKQAYAEK